MRRRLSLLAFFLSLTILPSVSIAQAHSTGIFGSADIGVQTPEHGPTSGQRDATAVEALTTHLKSLGDTSWKTLQGKGTITYAGSTEAPEAAELSLQGQDHWRLDVQTSQGLVSMRVHGSLGLVQRPGEERLQQLPFEKSYAGIVQFSRLRLFDPGGESVSVIDRGQAKVGESTLRRITVEAKRSRFPLETQDVVSVLTVDFYLDPATHLLTKSATVVEEPGFRDQKFLAVMSYSDYRIVNGALIPFHFERSLNGQPEWSLQLSDVTLNVTFPASQFTF